MYFAEAMKIEQKQKNERLKKIPTPSHMQLNIVDWIEEN